MDILPASNRRLNQRLPESKSKWAGNDNFNDRNLHLRLRRHVCIARKRGPEYARDRNTSVLRREFICCMCRSHWKKVDSSPAGTLPGMFRGGGRNHTCQSGTHPQETVMRSISNKVFKHNRTKDIGGSACYLREPLGKKVTQTGRM